MPHLHFSEHIQKGCGRQPTIEPHLHIVVSLLTIIPFIWKANEPQISEAANRRCLTEALSADAELRLRDDLVRWGWSVLF